MNSRTKYPKITFEQWAALKAVVDEGSHAAAAEVLHKSQSTISYLLARLNDQLPSPALVLSGRKAVLTEVGKLLYRQAVLLLDQAIACEESAAQIASGWENEIRLACDALTPTRPVMCALQEFSRERPLIRIRILETSLSGTDEAILQHDCDLAITGRVPPGFLADPLTMVNLVAVAHRDHALNSQVLITEAELETHRQIVVRDSGVRREQNAGWLGSEQRWTVSHFATSLEMVLLGLGFAFLPEHRVREQLDEGVLKVLPLEIGARRVLTLNILATSTRLGPGTRLLMTHLKNAFKQ